MNPRSSLLTKAMRFAQQHVRHVDPVRPRAAQGLVADVYRQVERDFGMLAPPISLHSPSPPVLAAAWLVLRETLLAGGQASRAAKEAVATAVSEANDCPYCVEVHSATQDRVGRDAAPAWLDGSAPVPTPVSEYVGVAVTFEYLNRMAHVFLPPSPFPPQAPTAARRQGRKVLGRIAAPRGAPATPGAALPLLPDAPLPDAPLPDDLNWSDGVISTALARATAAFDAAGSRSVDPTVRELVVRRVGLNGTFSTADALNVPFSPPPTALRPGLSRAWVDDAVAGLPPEQRPAGRLALLVAVAPYQVTDADVAAVMAAVGGDQCALVELTAWAAWTAARQAGRRYVGEGVSP